MLMSSSQSPRSADVRSGVAMKNCSDLPSNKHMCGTDNM